MAEDQLRSMPGEMPFLAEKSQLRPLLWRAEFWAGGSLLLRTGLRSTAGAIDISSQLSADFKRCLIKPAPEVGDRGRAALDVRGDAWT